MYNNTILNINKLEYKPDIDDKRQILHIVIRYIL